VRSRLTALGLSGFLLAAACPETQAPVAAPPTAEEKLARAMKLEDERTTGDSELEALLLDADDRVRARAALALGRLGTASAGSRLTPLLSDPSAYVRATAAFSLGILDGPTPPEAAAGLTEALADEEPRVRRRAAEVLASRGRAPPKR
jgi:HEAT repeat protein